MLPVQWYQRVSFSESRWVSGVPYSWARFSSVREFCLTGLMASLSGIGGSGCGNMARVETERMCRW